MGADVTERAQRATTKNVPSPDSGARGQTLSPVLARLIEEVRNETDNRPHGYDRVYNRHHRS